MKERNPAERCAAEKGPAGDMLGEETLGGRHAQQRDTLRRDTQWRDMYGRRDKPQGDVWQV